MRTTLAQVRQSRLPEVIGKCQSDLPSIAAMVNQAQQQLIIAGGETGWWGGWTKVVFRVLRAHPYITLPRQFARVINMDVGRFPIRIQNEFFEMLPDGIGLQDRGHWDALAKCVNWCGALEGYDRGVWPTMRDLTPTNQLLRVYITDPRDVGARILIGPAQDQNGNGIYTQDGLNSVDGFYIAFDQPFATSDFIVTNIGGIQKDATYGDVLLYQVDATTGAEVLLSRYAPDEINPAYRRYYLNRLPCCGREIDHHEITVTALGKLDFIPANRDTDFLIIGNIPALIEECKAIRFSDMEIANAVNMEDKSHAKAIKFLNQELGHYLGKLQPAVNIAPWGTARLEKQGIGTII